MDGRHRSNGWTVIGRWGRRIALFSVIAWIGWAGWIWASDEPGRLPTNLAPDQAATRQTPASEVEPPRSARAVLSTAWDGVEANGPSLVTVTPFAPPKVSLVKVGAWEQEATPLPAVAIRLEQTPQFHPLGKLLVVVATVVGEDGVPLADQAVEWSLDRQGIGDLIAAGGSQEAELAADRLAPFFARCHTAREPYELHKELDLPEPIEIQTGQAWCVLVGRSPGDMVLTSISPAVESISKRQAEARIHWRDADARFPESTVALAGTAVKLPVLVTNSKDEPQAGYRARFELLDAGGAAFESDAETFEIHSNSAGVAQAVLRQPLPTAGKSEVRIQLFGVQAFPGKPVALDEAVVEVDWRLSPVAVELEAPQRAAINQWTAVRFLAEIVGDDFPADAQVVAVFDPALDVSLEPPQAALGRSSGYEPPPSLTLLPPDDDDPAPPAIAKPPKFSIDLDDEPAKPSEPDENEPQENQPPPPARLEPVKPPKADAAEESKTAEDAPTPVKDDVVEPKDDSDPATAEDDSPPVKTLAEPPRPVTSVDDESGPEPGAKAERDVEIASPIRSSAKPAASNDGGESHFAHRQVVLGTLGPEGLDKTLAVRTATPSRRQVRIEVRRGEQTLASRQVVVDFASPQLVVEKRLPSKWRVDQAATYSVTVRNVGPFAIEKLQLRDQLPPGLRIEQSEALRFSDHLLWRIDRLEPEQEREFEVTARPTQLTDRLALRTWATAPDAESAETFTEIAVTGLAGVSLSVHDLADPVEVGKEVEYLIEAENRGNGPAHGVRFHVESPANLRLTSVDGSLEGAIVDGQLQLKPLPALPAGERLFARVRARSIAKGEARLSITLRHEAGGDLGIVAQESTNIFQPGDPSPQVQLSGELPIIQE